jgi:4-hydroxybenzoate polyprenyltransferase
MKHFLRLIRVVNLFIIVLTMIGVAYNLLAVNDYLFVDFHILSYSLLIFSTVIIAAAGNMINDYFDVKADRVNKPKKLIISKYLKKRWAIVIHWILNILAVFISILLTIRYNSFLFVFIHLISMNLLWFYSVYFKRKLLIGNIIVALLTALVPLLAAWYFKVVNESSDAFSPYHKETWSTYLDYSFIYFFAICAFFQNLAREISKDIQDVVGDKLIHVYSLPMKFGERKAGFIAVFLLQFPLIIGVFAIYQTWININLVSGIMLLTAALLNFSCLVLFFIRRPFPFEIINTVIKWSMLVGISALFTNTL